MKLFLSIILIPSFCLSQNQQIFKEQAFGKGKMVIYVGSGAVNRHIDWTKFKQETESYHRSPFINIGLDRCILPYASNAYWGIGPYVSTWLAKREYIDSNDNLKENIWSNTLVALRATHHNTNFVRKKLDMCSGIIVGTRIKYYHSKTINEKNITENNDRDIFYLAFGLTFTVRYYFYNNIGFYLDGGIGYKTDILALGLTYKMH